MTRALLLSACAALFLPGPAARAQNANHDPAIVPAGLYVVEPYHTQVIFSVAHLGFSNFSGFFSDAAGTLRLDPRQPAAARLDVTVDLASARTTVPKLDDELKGRDWFDVAHFAQAHFVSTAIVPEGPGHARIEGRLTLHGRTNPVLLEAAFVGSGFNPLDKAYTVGFQASGLVQRSAFGVSTYVPLVGDQVRLTIAGAFERKQAAQ